MAESKRSNTSASDTAAHVKNAAEVAKGKVKSATGKTLGNKKLHAEGQVDKIKGKAKQAGQAVKETLRDRQK
jgi:uncharacterized protein YjbJ (UPF0337 family)